MLEDTHTLVPVHNVDLLSYQYLPDQRHRVEERDEGDVAVADRLVRNVVHLHTVGHVANSAPCPLELVGDERHLVAPFNEALTQLVAMGFDTAELWEREIRADENAILLIANPGKIH